MQGAALEFKCRKKIFSSAVGALSKHPKCRFFIVVARASILAFAFQIGKLANVKLGLI